MRQRILETKEDLQKAANDLPGLEAHLPMVMTLTKGKKIRTEGQNKRHWAMIHEMMAKISHAIDNMAEHTGYTPHETQQVISNFLPPGHIHFVYAETDDGVHKHLKKICNIPTSTRLGTKEFSEFDEILEQTVAEVIGEINAATIKSGA